MNKFFVGFLACAFLVSGAVWNKHISEITGRLVKSIDERKDLLALKSTAYIDKKISKKSIPFKKGRILAKSSKSKKVIEPALDHYFQDSNENIRRSYKNYEFCKSKETNIAVFKYFKKSRNDKSFIRCSFAKNEINKVHNLKGVNITKHVECSKFTPIAKR